MFGVPIDFILFALTLLGVALFHHHTLKVALIGLAAITFYKVVFASFHQGAGLTGLMGHLAHEWVILTNLLGLLLGLRLLCVRFRKGSGRIKARIFRRPAVASGLILCLLFLALPLAWVDDRP